MNLRTLDYFVAVGEELSFTRAAARVHIQQAPFSQAIRKLEEQVGAVLLKRNTRGVELTEAGLAFLAASRGILQSYTDGVRAAQLAGKGLSGRLRVGYVAYAAYDLLPHIVRAFREACPQVALSLRQLISGEQIELIRRGELDAGMIRPAELPADVNQSLLLSEPFVCALPDKHRLAGRRRIRVRDLQGEPFIMLPSQPRTGFYRQIESILSVAGVVPRVVQEALQLDTMVGLVSAGIGVAIVPASVRRRSTEGVVFCDLDGTQARAEIRFVWKGGEESAAMRNLLVVARQARLRFAKGKRPARSC